MYVTSDKKVKKLINQMRILTEPRQLVNNIDRSEEMLSYYFVAPENTNQHSYFV